MKHQMRRRDYLIATVSATLALPGESVWAQADSRPVTIITPYAAGGAGVDSVVRPLAQRLQEMLGRTIVTDNKPGANGIIGTQYVLGRPADGTTILFHITSLVQVIALMRTKAPYDFSKDIQPLVLLGRQAVVLVVPASGPYQNMADLTRAAKANPVAFSFGSYGTGSTSHIYGEKLRSDWGIDMPHIAFRGTSPLLQEMLGGRIPMAFVSATTAIEWQGDKGLRAVAVAHRRRLEQLPQVPTMTELGYSGFEATGWWGLFLRSGTPAQIADPLRNAIRSILQEPDMQGRLRQAGLEPNSESPEQILAAMRNEYQHWEALSRRFNITAE